MAIPTELALQYPALHQPVGLPLVTNGPDNANANDNDNRQGGRCWSLQPV